jgi:DamX protein
MGLFAVGAGVGIALYLLLRAYPITAPASREPAAAATVAPPPAESAVSAAAPQANPPAAVATTKPVEKAAATPAPASPGPQVMTTIANRQNVAALPAHALPETEKPRVGANSQMAGPNADEFELRLAATKDWLAQSDKNFYSIQLFGADNPTQLKHHLNEISKFIEINNVYVYRTIAKQKPSLTVLYGSFNDRRAAMDALAKLPATLKANRPVLRTMQGIRAEIAQHQSS